MNSFYVVNESTLKGRCFLTPDERRQQNTDARRLNRIKMSRDEKAQLQQSDRA
jgi:hypothetical protein